MINALSMPSLMFYAFTPLIVLILVGLQLWKFDHNPKSWILIGVAVIWGAAAIMNVYIVAFVPSIFIANFQETYLVIRAAAVLVYIGVAVTSLIRKSERLKLVSEMLIGVIIADLLWSHLGGRYVGP